MDSICKFKICDKILHSNVRENEKNPLMFSCFRTCVSVTTNGRNEKKLKVT